MTVTYTRDVSNAEITAFIKTVFRWRGSLWKAVYVELFIWCLLYAIFSVMYRSFLNEEQQIQFERICVFAYKYGDLIPITFMLGFFVNMIIARWNARFESIGWVDNLCLHLAAYFTGQDDRSRMMRRAIARYMCLLQVMVFRTISSSIKKRFPTMDTLVAAGYIEKGERPDLSDSCFFLPVKWAMGIIREARLEGKIESDQAVQDIYQHLSELRSRLLSLWLADWVPVPLVYTQVVFISVRLYFVVALFGRQYVDIERNPSRGPLDAYVPMMTMMQFMVYVGWMKVAEALLNPFGDDDDDFECNWIIDRNLSVAMAIVDQPASLMPPLERDKFWKDGQLSHLYASDAVDRSVTPLVGSAIKAEKPRDAPVVMVPRTRRPSELPPVLNQNEPSVVIDPSYRRPSLMDRTIFKLASFANLRRDSQASFDIPVIMENGGTIIRPADFNRQEDDLKGSCSSVAAPQLDECQQRMEKVIRPPTRTRRFTEPADSLRRKHVFMRSSDSATEPQSQEGKSVLNTVVEDSPDPSETSLKVEFEEFFNHADSDEDQQEPAEVPQQSFRKSLKRRISRNTFPKLRKRATRSMRSQRSSRYRSFVSDDSE